MCAVSAITQYGQLTWPYPDTIPIDHMKHYRDMVEKAKKFDELTGQPDCEKPENKQWLKEVMDRLTKIEKHMLEKSEAEFILEGLYK